MTSIGGRQPRIVSAGPAGSGGGCWREAGWMRLRKEFWASWGLLSSSARPHWNKTKENPTGMRWGRAEKRPYNHGPMRVEKVGSWHEVWKCRLWVGTLARHPVSCWTAVQLKSSPRPARHPAARSLGWR